MQAIKRGLVRAERLQIHTDRYYFLLVLKQLRQLPEYDQHNLYQYSSLVCPASKLLNEKKRLFGQLRLGLLEKFVGWAEGRKGSHKLVMRQVED